MALFTRLKHSSKQRASQKVCSYALATKKIGGFPTVKNRLGLGCNFDVPMQEAVTRRTRRS
jgi:hypothetical protein